MIRSSSAPRFVAIAAGPRFGSRDEFVGYGPSFTLATAETKGWMDRQLDAMPEYLFTEGSVDVIDTQPERDLANWGPALPWFGLRSADETDSEDLPF